MNVTLKKFGYPETRLKEFKKWTVVLRPQQVTLGSLVIVCKEGATAFSQISRDAFAELRDITQFIEPKLGGAFSYEKINYLMLMMVDPDVHFHVIPRYSTSKHFKGQEFVDHGWPGPPNLKQITSTDMATNEAILKAILES